MLFAAPAVPKWALGPSRNAAVQVLLIPARLRRAAQRRRESAVGGDEGRRVEDCRHEPR